MLNRIIVMGRLTHDPELRRTQSGTSVCSFSIACDREYSKDEEKKTDFVDIVAWRSTGEFVSKYFAKGRMIIVEGRLQMRDWKDKDGNKRRSWEVNADAVHFGDSKPKQDDGSSNYGSNYDSRGTSGSSGFTSFADFDVPDGFDPGFGR